jgi:protein BCP1
MLGQELAQGRTEGKEIPDFTHYLVWGRGYKLEGTEEAMGLEMDGAKWVASQAGKLSLKYSNNGGGKKKKSKGGARAQMAPLQSGTFPYHQEEEFLERVGATYWSEALADLY